MTDEAAAARETADGENEATENDRRTGYYIAGHDWPAISNNMPISKIYSALNQISDDAVGAALRDFAEVSERAPAA